MQQEVMSMDKEVDLRAGIEETNSGAVFRYDNFSSGCMSCAAFLLIAAGFLALTSFIFFDVSLGRAISGVGVGLMTLSFFGPAYLAIVRFKRKLTDKIVFETKDEYLLYLNKKIKLSDIVNIDFSNKYHPLMMWTTVMVKTKNKKVHLFSTYNLVNESGLRKFIEKYINPYADKECKINWLDNLKRKEEEAKELKEK